jgi:dipeptidyl aminopeptidase/acylaminoacyl peptidase
MNTEHETPEVVRDWLQARARQRPDSRDIVDAALLEIAGTPQRRPGWVRASSAANALVGRGEAIPRRVAWLGLLALAVGVLTIGYVVAGAGRPRPLNVIVPPSEPSPAAEATARPAVVFGPTGLIVYTKTDEIHTLDPVTGQDQLVLQRPGVTGYIVGWSQDGKRILASDGTASYSMGPDGSDLRTVPLIDPFAWSPDASRFAHVVGKEVEVTDVHDPITKGFPLPPTKGLGQLGPWSPDGSSILAIACDMADTCSRSYSESLWRLDQASRTWHRLAPNGPGAIEAASWSPDGTRIVFSIRDRVRSVIWIVDPAGSGLTYLTPDATFSIGASWSPDGRMLAFLSNRDGTSRAYTMRVDGTAVQRVTSGRLNDFGPVWSPDGRWLAVVRSDAPALDADTGAAIWIVGADGSGEREVATGKGLGGLAWQPAVEVSAAPAPPLP